MTILIGVFSKMHKYLYFSAPGIISPYLSWKG